MFEMLDNIYVPSLPSSTDRREHITKHFRRFGIQRYTFVDAYPPDCQEVEEAYANEIVKRFPPCFRCGRERCLCANNVLVPPQVATFFSHRKIWALVSKMAPGYYGIFEDDVCFSWYSKYVLQLLKRNDSLFKENEKRESVLVRLGWARNWRDHHFRLVPKVVENRVRMSNPAYVITPRFARQLLDSFHKIETTVDIYAHQEIGTRARNYTVLPAIAMDLSWSKGRMSSLIHPRKKQLFASAFSGKKSLRREIDHYVKHIRKAKVKRVLGVGHPRTGSGYLSRVLSAFGLDVGHEKMGRDGIVSWMFSVYDLENPWALNRYAVSRYYSHFSHTILHVRDPFRAASSIIRENINAPGSFDFRNKHISRELDADLRQYSTDLEIAMRSIILWDRVIHKINNVDFVYKIEDAPSALFEFLEQIGIHPPRKIRLPDTRINKDKPYRGVVVPKKPIPTEDWNSLSETTKQALNHYCDKYKYPRIFDNGGGVARSE